MSNGFSNWHTWEAFNLLTNHTEETYRCALGEREKDNLEALVAEVLIELDLDVEHLLFSQINWEEVIEALARKEALELHHAKSLRKPKLSIVRDDEGRHGNGKT